ncbi:MAG TPA: flagellar type III secretion system pore protein FliP, partial [Schlesneria sp.]
SATAQDERQTRHNPVSVQAPQQNREMRQLAPGRLDDAAKVIDAAAQAQVSEVLPHIDPATVGTSLRVLVAMTILGLVPSILMMTTCFVRFSIVLGLLRQALGTSQALPGQISTALAMFLTFLVMSPVWQRAYDDGIRPYTNPVAGVQPLDEATAFQKTVAPLRDFMARQIDQAGNADAVWMLIDYQRSETTSQAASDWNEPKSYDDIGLNVLAPAYLLSELKVAFLIGFQIFLPFLVIDLVVASILTSLGLNMLPPSMVSLPFKLLLFVLIDGWFLTIGMLLESVRLA